MSARDIRAQNRDARRALQTMIANPPPRSDDRQSETSPELHKIGIFPVYITIKSMLLVAFTISLLFFAYPSHRPGPVMPIIEVSRIDIQTLFHSLNSESRYMSLSTLSKNITADITRRTEKRHYAESVSFYLSGNPRVSYKNKNEIERAAYLASKALRAESDTAENFEDALRDTFADIARTLSVACNSSSSSTAWWPKMQPTTEKYIRALENFGYLLTRIKKPLRALTLAATVSSSALQNFTNTTSLALPPGYTLSVKRSMKAENWFQTARRDLSHFTRELAEDGLVVEDLIRYAITQLGQTDRGGASGIALLREIEGMITVLGLVVNLMRTEKSIGFVGTECRYGFEGLRELFEELGKAEKKEPDGFRWKLKEEFMQ